MSPIVPSVPSWLPSATLTKRNLKSVCLEVERWFSYPKDLDLKKKKKGRKEEREKKKSSQRVLVAWTAKFLSTKICLYPTQPGELPDEPEPLRTNGSEETLGKPDP